MRVRLLPRETAAAITTGAVSAMGRGVGAAAVLLAVPILIETMVARGHAEVLPLALLMLGVVFVGIVAVILRPRPGVALVYLLVAGAATVVFQMTLLAHDPSLLGDAVYVANRPTLALVCVTVTSATIGAGIAWTVLGFVVATGAAFISAVVSGVPFVPGYGPALILVLSIVGYLTLALVQLTRRRSVPDFEQLEHETRMLSHGEDLARRSTAVVHDTVLNDLAVVMNAPDRLDERARDRLLADLETLESEDWLRQTSDTAPLSDLEADLRNEIAHVMAEFQWRGLTIHATASASAEHPMAPDVRAAMMGALRACLENVVRHSGATSAEVGFIADEESVTLMITDRGSGFDPAAVASDRLGLRTSVTQRVEAVGGHVKIWSAPGSGTSIVITAPAVGPVRDKGRR